ncbi:glutathione hydrolase-like YwrD proenzyme [Ambystoma mexicanum]|uniref:glutathione hydrolase-like YwrD proenzyme n=1 Tax=Ambystoma mexicanum TaxID=8296 RepID=UPI0037E8B1BE
MASELEFISRRSPILCTGGCVATSQPLATNIGLDILKRGGNAADAAVAAAAALNLTEPFSTGVGGDCFCLFYDAKTKQVSGINGSGRCPTKLSIDLLKQQGFDEANPLPQQHAHTVTVPGAAAAWCDTITLFGSKKLTLAEILQPSIELAEKGFPVSEITAYLWKQDWATLQAANNQHGAELLIEGEAPRHGQVFRNPFLAETFKELSKSGKKGFYEGRIAEAIVQLLKSNGSVMTLEDLKNHKTEQVQPIFTTYKGVKVWELPPNGQGLTALMTLNLLEDLNVKAMHHNSADYLHVLVEALKLSVSDSMWYCTDPACVPVPTQELISKDYSKRRSALVSMHRANNEYGHGSPLQTGSDTVYLTVVDAQGNACSFINSIYKGFGTGLVPSGCGFTLQNRGVGFSLSPSHPNCLSPGKRPFHTILPAMATHADTGELLSSFGVVGGFMQPQGHVQVLLNMLEFGMNPQRAVDAARCYVEYSKKDGVWKLFLEDGIAEDVTEELRARGHTVQWPVTGQERKLFGRGQIITMGDWWSSRNTSLSDYNGIVRWAGSDPRGDGCAMGY